MAIEVSKLILVTVVVVWCLGAGVEAGFTYEDKEVETLEGKKAMFEKWRSHHNMEAISEQAKMKQFEAFKANLETVHGSNKQKKGYKLAMNKFAGMTKAEFKSKYASLQWRSQDFISGWAK